jgi:hypothetical protein
MPKFPNNLLNRVTPGSDIPEADRYIITLSYYRNLSRKAGLPHFHSRHVNELMYLQGKFPAGVLFDVFDHKRSDFGRSIPFGLKE